MFKKMVNGLTSINNISYVLTDLRDYSKYNESMMNRNKLEPQMMDIIFSVLGGDTMTDVAMAKSYLMN